MNVPFARKLLQKAKDYWTHDKVSNAFLYLKVGEAGKEASKEVIISSLNIWNVKILKDNEESEPEKTCSRYLSSIANKIYVDLILVFRSTYSQRLDWPKCLKNTFRALIKYGHVVSSIRGTNGGMGVCLVVVNKSTFSVNT